MELGVENVGKIKEGSVQVNSLEWREYSDWGFSMGNSMVLKSVVLNGTRPVHHLLIQWTELPSFSALDINTDSVVSRHWTYYQQRTSKWVCSHIGNFLIWGLHLMYVSAQRLLKLSKFEAVILFILVIKASGLVNILVLRVGEWLWLWMTGHLWNGGWCLGGWVSVWTMLQSSW